MSSHPMPPLAETDAMANYEAETPFVSDPYARGESAVERALSPARVFGSPYQLESPFTSEYEALDGAQGVGPQAERFAAMLGEVYDREFEEAVADLVAEATALGEDRFASEAGDVAQEGAEVQRGLAEYLAPLERECESALDRLAAELEGKDLAGMSEAEVDSLLETSTAVAPGTSPVFENFVGKLLKKAKKAVKAVRKVLPHNLVLGKIKGLVRPLIQRVLKFAIGKLPVAVRPIAQRLARHFTGTSREAEGEGVDEAGEAAALEPGTVAEEFDVLLAGYLTEGEDFERRAAVEQFVGDQESGPGDALGRLEMARADFARQVTQGTEGEPPVPQVERFVPAILGALRVGIKIVGRPRVVNYLAGLVAKLISKYVGKQQAASLSRSLVDTGLGLVGLEAPSDETLEAGYTLAATVEDTVNRVVQSAPEAAWESEALLETYVHEAFERSAAAHFPDPLIRAPLRESAKTSGAWVLLPVRSRRKRYKKYTHVPEVTLTPQVAASITSFAGVPLQSILRDQLGLPQDQPITARVHLYEAIPGTTLSRIALLEKKVYGLGTARREAWSLVHPLTPEAAGFLLNDPGLGRRVPARFLADRNLVNVGQRFYYLEIVGAQRRPGPARVSQTSVVLDFPRGQVRVFLYYSEADAQALAQHMRRKAPLAILLTAFRAGLEARVSTLLSGEPTRGLRLIHEAVPTDRYVAAIAREVLVILRRQLLKLLVQWVLEALQRELERRYDRLVSDFTRAADTEADGVTIVITYQRPSFFEPLRGILTTAAKAVSAVAALALPSTLSRAFGDLSLEIRSGYAYW